MEWGNKSLFLGLGHMTEMATMTIFKNLLRNRMADDLEIWYAALVACMARSKSIIPYHKLLNELIIECHFFTTLIFKFRFIPTIR